MDGESIRNGLRDIFGDFNDLCQQISNTSGALSHRHGVVAPATPVGPRPNPFAPNNNTSRPRTPPSTQSARICLQTMTDLVEDTPLQPPAPASFNRDLHQEPSTSSKTTEEPSDVKRKKRKNKTNDSDSDMETRKRHADHSSKPSTSRGALPPPVYKDLFGDDNSKPAEAPEKAISPDSGVHSNEGIDETDISQIIHVMSNLMPMLSPITNRPQDRDRQRKEKSERRARKELEKKRREEEREKREQEEKDRRRREERELERKAAEEREQREAEEKERREAEDRLRREQEEEKRQEEERARKEVEERQRLREEEKQRKEEERLRKAKREEEKQRKEAEKKRKEAEELEKIRLEKEREKEEKKMNQEEADRQSPDSKFSGTLTLRNLSNDRLSQLLDIGRRSTKLEKLEGGRNSSRPASPYASKTEKEDRVASEGKLESRLEVKNVPSPRSSSSKRDFHCAGNECIPQKPILPAKVKDGEGASPGEVYQEMAKAKKRQADIQDDKVKRILLYLECMVYFTMAAQFYITHERNGYSHLSIIRDTATLISGVTNRFLYHDALNPLDQHFASRVRVLSIRAQSILGFHAFNIKMASTIKTASMIDKSGDTQCQFHSGDDQQPVPSPSESLNSGSNPAANMMVTMPVEVYNCYKTQLRHLHGLMNAHKLWADSASYISKSTADTLFINSVESLCGALTIVSPIDKLAIFILTAVSWLRDEQELELKRPQPPPLKEPVKTR